MAFLLVAGPEGRRGAAALSNDERQQQPRPITVEFANGNQAGLVFDGPHTSAATVVEALGLRTGRPAVIVAGGAETLDPRVDARLRRLLEHGVVKAATAAGAVLLDGGTASGVMAALGRSVAVADSTPDLVGVAPAGAVTYPGDEGPATEDRTQLEPNHSHFVLADADTWGGETSLLFDVVDALTAGSPAVLVLAGGGPIALEEVDAAASRHLPIVVLAGSGRLANHIARGRAARAEAALDASRLRRVLERADITAIELDGDPDELAAVLGRLLQGDDTLRDALRVQATISAAARREQRSFRMSQALILVLGVVLTTLAVSKAVLDRTGFFAFVPWLDVVLHNLILIIPIAIAALVAAAGRMRSGTRWVLLRGTAESLKREIFRYRVRAGIYSRPRTQRTTREEKLAQAVGAAVNALMRTDVNMIALNTSPRDRATGSGANEPTADELNVLSATAYLAERIDGQIDWYQASASRLARNVRALHWLALLFGAIGTYLAAIGQEVLVAITTAVAGAYTTYREAWQLETTIVLYNQAAANLASIRGWWSALSPAAQGRQQALDRLVESTERIVRAEQAGWVQEMQDAMSRLQLGQDDTGAHDDSEAEDEEANGDDAVDPGTPRRGSRPV